jgi:endonuclease/exonuclease/phosphatase family metal-dependent hydrolase
MVQVLSYNILAGGYTLSQPGGRRTKQLVQIIRSVQPDIVGLIEATHPSMTQRPLVVEEIAQQLGMRLIMGENATHEQDYQLALLTRLPVISTRLHPRPGLLNKPLLELCVEEENGQPLTAFVTHLTAAFSRYRTGDAIRRREMQEILRIMAPLREQGQPHLLMGDFNSLAPGDAFVCSKLLSYIVHLDEQRHTQSLGDGHPHLDFVVPRSLHFLNPLLRTIPQSRLLSMLFDAVAALYDSRGTIRLICKAGYVDCYRHLHPKARGFTCPASLPAGRIDYIFADPVLAQRLENCYVVTEGEGLPGKDASDHLPVAAEYRPISVREHEVPATEYEAREQLLGEYPLSLYEKAAS